MIYFEKCPENNLSILITQTKLNKQNQTRRCFRINQLLRNFLEHRKSTPRFSNNKVPHSFSSNGCKFNFLL